MGQLGSGVWVSASFQMFALTAGGECHSWGVKEIVRGNVISLLIFYVLVMCM